MSQTTKVLARLQKVGSITPQYAYTRLGIYRLSARVMELRDQGHKIITERKKGKCATYRLVA